MLGHLQPVGQEQLEGDLHECWSPEMQLLLLLGRYHPRTDEMAEACRLLGRVLDCDLVFKLAVKHGIAGLAFRALAHDSGPAGALRQQLQCFARKSAIQAMVWTQELLRLHALFQRAGIPVLHYKGPVLSALIYGDFAVREFCDLDFFIEPAAFPALRELLGERGYQPEQLLPPRLGLRYFSSADQCGFAHSTSGVRLDVHWAPAPHHFGFKIDSDWLWEGQQQVSIANAQLPTMQNEKLFLLLAIHGSKHAWSELKWLCDVANLLRSGVGLNWSEVREHAHRAGAQTAVSLALRMARDLMAAPLPPQCPQDARSEKLARHCVRLLARPEAERFSPRARWWVNWQVQPGWPTRLRSALSFLLSQPPVETESSHGFDLRRCRRILATASAWLKN